MVRSLSEGKAVLVTDDMAAPPQGKVFELWLQDETGTMLPAGLMPSPGDDKVLLEGDAAKATGVGITVEPEGGSPEPTSRADRPVRPGQGRVMTPGTPHRVAVVGSGVAGLTAAHVLGKRAHVTLFEADSRLGGHADTHVVEAAVAVDTGFIVHNERTYPHLLRLFDELGVETQDSEMSMSVRDDGDAGWSTPARSACPACSRRGAHALRPSYLRMLTEIPRFHRMAKRLLATLDQRRVTTTRRSARSSSAGRFSPLFRTHFMESLVACVWSCDPAVALDYPARYLFTFLEHHGMLGVFGSPQWRTVTGGSREYVERVAARLPDVRTGTKVTSVLETPTGVEITDGNGRVDDLRRGRRRHAPRTRRWRCWPRPTQVQRDVLARHGVLPQHRAAAHRHQRAAATATRPGVVELPAPAVRRRTAR